MSDYYSLLGVERTADAATIKRAYRKRALELHPDRNPDDPAAEEQFRELTAAYEVLSDDERRAIYDRYGEDGLKQRHWEPQYASFTNIADIFSAFFGDEIFGGRSQSAMRGDDIVVEASLSLREAALGATRDLQYMVAESCDRCDGKGAQPENLTTCDTCHGQGSVRTVARSLLGQIVQQSLCPDCGGQGQRIVTPCEQCGGHGMQRTDKELTVEIPAGISSGQRIRLSGRGHAGALGGPPGNLYVQVVVNEDDRFLRDGDNLVSSLDLTFAEAALGCERQIETVEDGLEQIEVPAGTQTGEILTLRGHGMGRLRGNGRGDLRLVVNVMVPREITDEQRALLEQFQAVEHDRNYASDETLFGKLRRILRQ